MKYILFIATIIKASAVFAQTNGTPEQTYRLAKEFMQEGRYGLAMDQFELLTENNKDHIYAEYASYFYAICAYKEGYPALARDMFHQITRKFPEWGKMDEVNYWLSVIYFESGDYYRGFEYSTTIEDQELLKTSENTQNYFLLKVNDTDSLKDLYNLFGSNPLIAEKLLNALLSEPFSSRDFLLIDEISESFPYLAQTISEKMPASEIKDSYEVSLLLPFARDMLSLNYRTKPNEFVFDLYRGIQLAIDSLNSDSEKINLRAYDTQRDTSVIRQILDQPELANSDFIIGPLYHTELISEYSEKNQINVLHPLSKNYSLTTSNPFFYLFTARPMQVVINAAQYLREQEKYKRGIVFYKEAALEEMLVELFLDSLNTGDSIRIEAIGIANDDVKTILNTLTTGTIINQLSESEDRIKGDSIDFIYVLAMEKAVKLYSDVLTAVEARGDTIKVFGSTNWMNDQVIDPSVFDRLNVSFSDPDFINTTSPAYTQFTNRYLELFGILPSKYAVIGYESMMYFGSQLIEHGNQFQYALAEIEEKSMGIMMADKNYFRSNTNLYVPLIQWEVNRFKIIGNH